MTSEAELEKVRILVCITSLFRLSRMGYLFQVLQTLMDLDVAYLDINVFTETDDPSQLAIFERLFDKFRRPKVSVTTHSHPETKPYLRTLPWVHKPFVRSSFDENHKGFTHYLYIEEDIRFSPANLKYFLEYRPLLKSAGLIPGYIRIEFNHLEGDIFTADQRSRSLLSVRKIQRAGDFNFCCLDEPYTAMHIMDTELVEEYILSPAFDLTKSESVMNWGEPERAAMGLTFTNSPEDFSWRTVVPFVDGSTYPDLACWVHHLPSNYTNNYVEDGNFILGKTRLDETILY